MRAAGFFVGVFCCGSLLRAEVPDPFVCSGLPPSEVGASKVLAHKAPRRIAAAGTVEALVIHARFADEPARPVPAYAASLLDVTLPGSLSHYFESMSSGQLQLRGTVLQQSIRTARGQSAYVTGRTRGYTEFARDILEVVDSRHDLGQFDNDGPDGVANSGDDDGWVDYVFVQMHTVPAGFIAGRATGIAGLGFEEPFVSRARTPDGQPIRVSGGRASGALLQARSQAEAVGVMAHEFGHALGLPDLYDLSHTTRSHSGPADDSAGIGAWGLMGHGALGFDGTGPSAMSAWSRERLGWIGRDNEQLRTVTDDVVGLSIGDTQRGGVVIKVPLPSRVRDERALDEDYLLLEQRDRNSSPYHADIPGEGVLVWHVQPHAFTNNDEDRQLVDLISADGRFDLDRWSRDPEYAAAHGGNLGDGSDPFDGQVGRIVSQDSELISNPWSHEPAYNGLSIDNLRRIGETMVVDIAIPHWSGTVNGDVQWSGTVRVTGDVTVAAGARLRIAPGAVVHMAPATRLHVEGRLELPAWTLFRFVDAYGMWRRIADRPVSFTASESGTTWLGLSLGHEEAADMAELDARLQLSDARHQTPVFVGVEGPEDPATSVLANNADISVTRLLPAAPNPANPSSSIRFVVGRDGETTLTLYNALGQPVRTLARRWLGAGEHQLHWDGSDDDGYPVGSGVYFIRLTAGGRTYSSALTLVQ